MSDIMTREETREIFNDLKADVKDSMARIEAKIDVATDNINKYAKDTIEHSVEIKALQKDVDSIGCKVRFNQKFMWSTSGGLAVLLFVLNYIK